MVRESSVLGHFSLASEMTESSSMYESMPTSSYDKALIDALCEGDTSAWCFLPAGTSESACCSPPFRVLWQLPLAAAGTGGTLSQTSLAGAFEATGVPAAEFLARVAEHCSDIPVEIQLLQKDETRIQASVRCVFGNRHGEVIGRLVHFRVLSDTNEIAGLLDQISVARKQLEILSKRETEILNLVYEGRTNKAISITTGISEKTVEKHRSRIMLKLGLGCTTLMIRIITVAKMLPSPHADSAEGSSEELYAQSSNTPSVQ